MQGSGANWWPSGSYAQVPTSQLHRTWARVGRKLRVQRWGLQSATVRPLVNFGCRVIGFRVRFGLRVSFLLFRGSQEECVFGMLKPKAEGL